MTKTAQIKLLGYGSGKSGAGGNPASTEKKEKNKKFKNYRYFFIDINLGKGYPNLIKWVEED